MLSLPKGLLFPSLKFHSDVRFTQPSSYVIKLYTLDWSRSDQLKRDLWAKQFPCEPHSGQFQGTLPDKQLQYVDSMLFAIPEKHLKEIRYNSLQAAESWQRTKEWKHGPDEDSWLRSVYAPAQAFVQAAFHLLADCLYDVEKLYWSRSEDKLLAPFLLSYRFWCYQIKPDLLEEYSNLPDLSRLFDQGLFHSDQAESFIYSAKSHIIAQEANLPKKEKERVRIIPPASLDDFISNSVGSVQLTNLKMDIPDVGKVSMVKPILRRKQGKITIHGEFECRGKDDILPKLINNTTPFEISFSGGRHKGTAVIFGLSTTPPPTLTLTLDSITRERVPEEGSIIGKIDKEKIKKAEDDPEWTINTTKDGKLRRLIYTNESIPKKNQKIFIEPAGPELYAGCKGVRVNVEDPNP